MSQTHMVFYTPDLNLPPTESDPEAVFDSVMDFTYIDDEFHMMLDFIDDWDSGSGDSDVPMAEQSGLDTNRVSDYGGGGYNIHDDAEFEELLAQLYTQFSENENHYILPSASNTVVDNLESVVITQLDVDNDNVTCAVCLDDMNVGDVGNQLPCFHRYHADCIVRWLVMKNTCPVCRYHLPTDDL